MQYLKIIPRSVLHSGVSLPAGIWPAVAGTRAKTVTYCTDDTIMQPVAQVSVDSTRPGEAPLLPLLLPWPANITIPSAASPVHNAETTDTLRHTTPTSASCPTIRIASVSLRCTLANITEGRHR